MNAVTKARRACARAIHLARCAGRLAGHSHRCCVDATTRRAPEPLARHAMRRFTAWLMVACSTCIVGACGPGTGGTGDGENHGALIVFGASTANVCDSALGTALSCQPLGGSTASTGTLAVSFVDAGAGNGTTLTLSQNLAHLELPCAGLQFDGEWGQLAADDRRYFGTYTAPGLSAPAPASLTVQAVAGSTDLIALLRRLDGSPLAGPLLLHRTGLAAAAAVSCPS